MSKKEETKSEGKVFGLIYQGNEGTPNTPHRVIGLPGLYNPHRATPVGGEGELPLELAQAASDDSSIPVELVELKKNEVDDLREQADADRGLSRRAAAAARRTSISDAETLMATAEIEATK